MNETCHLYKYMCFIIFTIPITKIIDGFIPIMNTCVSISMVLLLTLYFVFYKYSGYIEKYNITLLGAVYILSLILAENKGFAIVEQLKWTLFILLIFLASDLNFISYMKDFFVKNITWIYNQLLICIGILIISLFFNGSYTIIWEGRYLKSVFEEPHLFTAYLFYILALLIFINKYIHSKFKYILIATIMILSLFTGARVIAISTILLFLLWLINNKEYKVIFILLIISIFIIIKFGDQIPLVEKFISSSQNEYGGIMSGRDVFTIEDLKEYFRFSPMHLLVGKGIDYPNLFNKQTIGMYIYAHNDIINTLLSNGLIGLYLYLYGFFKLYRVHRKNIKKTSLIFLISIYFINILLNGLFSYSSMVYAFILLLLFLASYDKDKSNILNTSK
ncbi:hypothetical protein [Romboutsia lituseburensis]|uniref:hypothetical protein n=1 Tax=Romboutsia lituseburensis TaxID=1537 RepID=UPI00215B57BB|nr:hypothetical protein [Romboutsia lituseburensis]MCR8746794.1 hypothetical protein [Romboutsia lituseburensis]